MSANLKDLPYAYIAHIQHLRAQIEHLEVLKEYHQHQMNLSSNRQLTHKYRLIADAISELISHYKALLKELNVE